MSGFANAVVGGVGKLIRKWIQSPDYVSGVSGWTINKDGTAEFNDVFVRGDLFFYQGVPAHGNLIMSLTSNGGTDPYGNQYSEGITLGAGFTNVVFTPENTLQGGDMYSAIGYVSSDGNSADAVAIDGPYAKVGGGGNGAAKLRVGYDWALGNGMLELIATGGGNIYLTTAAGKTILSAAQITAGLEVDGALNALGGASVQNGLSVAGGLTVAGSLTVTGGVKETEFRSASTGRSGVSDNFAAGVMAPMGSVNLPANAPAGSYLITCACNLSCNSAAHMYFRILAGAANITADQEYTYRMTSGDKYPWTFASVYQHAGGALAIAHYVEVSAGTGTVYNTPYHLDVTYLGS